jgi:multiple sugar transport system substrate-binding protein
MQMKAAVLATALLLAPFGARAADLVVWWDEGYYAQEDEAVREIIAAFEKETGKRAELAFYPQAEVQERIDAALEAGEPPDFAFGLSIGFTEWLSDDRLVDLTDTVGPFSSLFDPDALAWWSYHKAGRTSLIALPMGRATNHVHVWRSLLEQAGFTLDDIPSEWDAFWSFWCDEVQPAVRRATGREDIWGVGPRHVGRGERYQRAIPAVPPCQRGGLGDPRRPAGHRRPRRPAQARRGHGQLHRHLPQGVYAT